MRDWPHGVTGTRNPELLAALTHAVEERRVTDAEFRVYSAGFIDGWQERSAAKPGTVNVDRDYLADLERRAGIGGA